MKIFNVHSFFIKDVDLLRKTGDASIVDKNFIQKIFNQCSSMNTGTIKVKQRQPVMEKTITENFINLDTYFIKGTNL